MTPIEIIREISRIKAEKVLRWLYEQEPADTAVFRLSLLFNETVLPAQVQGFARHILGAIPVENTVQTPEEISDLVKKSFEHCSLFLSAPNVFTPDFLTQGTGSISDIAIAQNDLATLQYYSYYAEFLSEWLTLQTAPISIDDLRSITRQIDRLIIFNSSEQQIETYLESFFNYFRDAEITAEQCNILINCFVNDKGVHSEIDLTDYTAFTLATYLKQHLDRTEIVFEEQASTNAQDITEEDYTAFIDELKQAGVHLPLPSAMRQAETPIVKKRTLPIQLFIDSKLENKLIKNIFHSNRNEYERMLTMINHAGSYLESILNLETTLHLQKASRSEKLLTKFENAIKMKFEGGNTTDAIR